MKKILAIVFNNLYFYIFYIFTSFTYVTALKIVPYINILAKIALLWGILISFNHIYNILKRKPYSIECFIFLFLFITFIVNLLAYDNINNITTWCVNFVLLTGVLFVNKEKTKSTLEKELFIISNFYVCLTFIFSSISIALSLLNKELTLSNFTVIGKGGFFENENALGISAALSLVITLYLIFSTTSKQLKLLYIINFLIQAYLVLTSSARTAYFVFIALLAILVLIQLRKTILRILFLTIPFLSTIYIFTLKEDILNHYTTNRDAIWTSAALVIKDNLLLGVGNLDLIQKVLAARTVYIPEGINTGRLHNIYIEVLATNGIFAFVSLTVFILISLFYIFK
jgi:O-antigen ligase